MSVKSISYSLAAVLVAYAAGASGADKTAGEALVSKQCAECHEAADWQGESAESLEALIKGVVAGQTKHKIKLQLSDAQIADVAAFWSTASAKK